MRLRYRLAMAALLAAVGAGPIASGALAQGREPEGQQNLDLDSPELRVLGTADPSVRKATVIVNGDIITDTDIEQRLNLVVAANGGRLPPEERQRLQLQVLRNLIDEKLEIQEAKANEIVISDAEVESAYKRVVANFKMQPDQFAAYLAQYGSSPASLKQQIRGEMAWSRLLRRKVEPQVNVGDDEVNDVIARLNAAKGKDEYRVGEIFLTATPETQAQVMQDAARIVAQVRQGASFVAYARQFSEASTAGVGGDLGWVRAEQLNDAVSPVVRAMNTGTISDPIAVPGGVAIMALIDKRQVLSADPADAVLSLKQITVPVDLKWTEAQANAMVQKFEAASQAMGGCGRADAFAKEWNGEVSSNDQIKLRDLPPPLQAVLKNMSVGQSTPPFGSAREGIRVLVLCGRDDAAVAKAPTYDEVYAQINEERVTMRARRYLRDLRRDAIIEYR